MPALLTLRPGSHHRGHTEADRTRRTGSGPREPRRVRSGSRRAPCCPGCCCVQRQDASCAGAEHDDDRAPPPECPGLGGRWGEGGVDYSAAVVARPHGVRVTCRAHGVEPTCTLYCERCDARSSVRELRSSVTVREVSGRIAKVGG